MNKQVRAYLVYFSTERKGVIRNYLARSSRYLPMIKEVFEEIRPARRPGLPGHDRERLQQQGHLPAAACGMWQFIKGTGCATVSPSTATWTNAGTRRRPPRRRPSTSWTSISNSLLVSGGGLLQLWGRPGAAGVEPEQPQEFLGTLGQHVPAHRDQELRAPDDCGHHHRQKPGEIRLQERRLSAAHEGRQGAGDRAHVASGRGLCR